MGRHKKEITKTVYIKCRVEKSFKDEHISFCKKLKITPSKHLRMFLESELNKTNNNNER
jgi:antitoxin component of RelBE/YafQ-DinJ toxin-antitoxin module